MKKIRKLISALLLLLCAAFTLTSCADAEGLHNQTDAKITFEFRNFADISGDYTIPGNFNDWNNSKSLITMKDGNGTSEAITVSNVNIEFTLIQTGDSGWLRPWYTAGVLEGNGVDRGTAGNPFQNFYINALDLNAGEITLIIDGADVVATPLVQ